MRTFNRFKKLLLLSTVLIFICYTVAYTGTTGKIAGNVLTKVDGNPLIGANILIVSKMVNDTEVELPIVQGAASDNAGYYSILNIDPGNYILKCTYMGYKETFARDVIVSVDKTTLVNFDMEEITIEGETIYITAERDVISKDVSATQVLTKAEELETLPVNYLSEVINYITPGVMAGSFRGGSGRAQYFADGMSLNFNESYGGSFTNLNLLGISEMQVLLGGFSAEYGNVQDGIVNIIKKRPTRRFTFAIDANYAPAQHRHFFSDIFSPEMPFPKSFRNKQYFYDNPDKYPNPDSAYAVFMKQTEPFNYIYPEDHINAFLSGPVPYIDFLGFTLGLSHHYVPGRFPSSRRKEYYGNEDAVIEPALHFKFGHNMNLTFGGLYDHHKSQLTYLIPVWELYFTSWHPLEDTFIRQYYMRWSHVVSPGAFYEVRTSYSDYHLQDHLDKDFNFEQERAIAGHQILGGDWYNLRNLRTKTLTLEGDFTSQITGIHQFKAGAGVKIYQIDNYWKYHSTGSGRTRGSGKVEPREGHAYIMDKIETRGMIANVGLRFDWFDPNSQAYANKWEPVPLDLTPPEMKDVGGQYAISPRLGISFPISERSMLYANYGHFVERADLNTYFGHEYTWGALSIKEHDYNDLRSVDWLGNPDLKYQQTIAYELGVRAKFGMNFYTDISGYYKNITNQRQNFNYISPDIGYSYEIMGNGTYADVRGVQVRFVREKTRWYGVTFGYTYQFATEGVSTPSSITPKNQAYPRANDYPRNFDVRHYAFINLLVTVPNTTGPQLFGFYPFGGYNITFLTTARSGTPFTYQPIKTEVNNYRGPAVANTDMLIEKVLFSNIILYAQITNLLNRKQRTFVEYRGMGDIEPWVTTSTGECTPQNVNFRSPREYPRYEQFGPPRMILFGIRVRN